MVTHQNDPPRSRRADVADSYNPGVYNPGVDVYEALWSPVIFGLLQLAPDDLLWEGEVICAAASR
jgi:hypothetical protein